METPQDRYDKKNIRRVVVKFNRATEPDLVDYIESTANMSGLLKDMARRAMETEQARKAERSTPVKTVDEILANWDEEQFRDWYAVDEFMPSKSETIRLYVGPKEIAKRKATDLLSALNLLDPSESHHAEWGEYDAESTPFFRCLLISAEEARSYFEELR